MCTVLDALVSFHINDDDDKIFHPTLSVLQLNFHPTSLNDIIDSITPRLLGFALHSFSPFLFSMTNDAFKFTGFLRLPKDKNS